MIHRQDTSTTVLDRHCVVCGKKMLIKVFPSKKYQGGNFFGDVEIDNDRKAEYWECDRCYNN